MKKWLGAYVLVCLTMFVANSSFAASYKAARANDVASRYELDDQGNFYRYVGNNKCQITNNVQNFKVSEHPYDAAMVYFEKDGNLWVLNNADRVYPCPRAEKKVIMYGVREYKVVSNTNTTIVNIGLSNSGEFVAWDNRYPVLRALQVEDVVMNSCFGVQGKSFSSYVAFVINRDGAVLKVRGDSPGTSKWDTSHRWYNLREFKDTNRVCAYQ